AQLDADRKQAGAGAGAFNTRKSVRQQQLGIDYRRTLSDDDMFDAMIYRGRRNTVQFQSIPVASQKSIANPGGVLDLESQYWGSDTHLTHSDSIFGNALQMTGGLAFDNLDEARRGYLNYIGSTLGVEGDLRRDEANRVYDFDQYLQAQYSLSKSWLFEAGVRN